MKSILRVSPVQIVQDQDERARLLILGTYRETEVDQAHPLARALAELRRARALDSVTLAGLMG